MFIDYVSDIFQSLFQAVNAFIIHIFLQSNVKNKYNIASKNDGFLIFYVSVL